MTILRLAIDAAGMRAGAAEAQRALSEVGRAGEAAAQGVEQTNRALQQTGDIYGGGSRVFRETQRAVVETSRSFDGLQRSVGVASEALQIGGRVRAVGQEFTALGQGLGSVSNVSLQVAAGLIDVVQVTDRLRQARLAEQGVNAATGFSKFFAVLSGNPLLVASVAIAGIGSAMSLFASKTAEASNQAETLKRLLKELAQLRREQGFDSAIGRPFDARSDLNGTVNRLRDFALATEVGGGNVSVNDLAGILETNRNKLAEELAVSGQLGEGYSTYNLGATFGQVTPVRDSSKDFVSAQTAARLARERARQLQPPNDQFGPEYGPPAPDPTQLEDYLNSLRQETQLLSLSDDERQKVLATMQAEQIAKQQGLTIDETVRAGIRDQIGLQQQLLQAQELARAGSEAFAGAFFSIVTGANTARQAVAQLVQQLAALAQGQAIRGFGNAVVSLFGASPGQSMQDRSTIPGGVGPPQLDPNAIG